MLIFRIILVSILLFSTLFSGQPYWVFFEGSSENIKVTLSEKAQKRIAIKGRESYGGIHPVSPIHLDELRSTGLSIRHTSRFLNAASVEVDNEQDLEKLRKLDCTQSIQPVAHRISPTYQENIALNKPAFNPDTSYGGSYTQNDMIHIPWLHRLGYDGKGVTIGVFDTGFQTYHPAFDLMHIAAQYDFVDHEINPDGAGDNHGINVLSALGGYLDGKIIGPAYGATFLLARTEDTNSETRAEEDNWVAALEWADSLGVDIISSSLSYRLGHNDPSEDYPDSAIDGQTAVITRAANIAAERGILVVNSASNEGPGVMSIWPPSDSPHVLAVGAVNSQNEIAYFSGRGPTYDGRIKPDVVGMGVSVVLATGNSFLTYGSGTSYAAPLISGLAALLLEARPDLSPDAIIEIFHKNGHLANSPDNNFGYGLPDLRSEIPSQDEGVSRNCLIYPNPSGNGILTMVLTDPVAYRVSEVTIFDILGRQLGHPSFSAISETRVELIMTENIALTSQLLIVRITVDSQDFSGKYIFLNP